MILLTDSTNLISSDDIMDDTKLNLIMRCFDSLKVKMTEEELSTFILDNDFSNADIDAVMRMFTFLEKRNNEASIQMMLRLSKLPLKSPKTFENFDFSQVHGKNVSQLEGLQSLSTLYSHKNVALIGPAGTGKTHIAMAYGYECCQHKLKTYFIKMSELNDMFTQARAYGRSGRVISNLVKPSCLIIDEVGHCVFDRENTRMFFDLVDRRYNKEGPYTMIFTSNKQPSQWKQNFNEDDSLLCALDRIFDDALIFNLRGNSYRGKDCESYSLTTLRGKATNAELPAVK
ncbi:ATP-binding protein [Treponema sp.]